MKKYYKMLAKDTFLYGVGRSLVSIISFIMLPLYARILGKDGYGLLSLFISFSSFLIIFLRWGIPIAYTKFYYNKDDKHYRSVLLSTSIQSLIILNIPLIIALIILNKQISYFLTKSTAYSIFVIISVLTTYLSALHHMPYALFQTKRRVKTYIAYRTTFSLLTVLINLYVLFFTVHKVRNILLSGLITNTLFVFIWAPIYSQGLKNRIKFNLLKEILAFSTPLIVVSFSQWLLSMTDRIFLSHYFNLSDVGVYSFASKLANIFNIGIIYPFSVAWTPLIFIIEKDEDNIRIYTKLLKLWIYILTYISISLILVAPILIHTFGGGKFDNAYTPLWIIVMGILFFGIYQFLTFGPMIKKKTKYLSYITISAGIINILLNFIFIPLYNKVGAAITFFISNFSMALFALLVNYKLKTLKSSVGTIAYIFATIALLTIIGVFLPNINIFLKIGSWIILTALIIFLIIQNKEKIMH